MKSINEIDFIRRHKTYYNLDKVKRNIQSCNNTSKQSMTLKYQITWETNLNENIDAIRKNFEISMANAQVKGKMRHELFQSTQGICVNSVRDPMRIDNRPTSMPTISNE